MTIIWCIAPEIWSMTDKSFCYSGLFFALLLPYGPRKLIFLKKWKQTWRYYHFTNVYHKWQSYDIWFLRYGVQRTKFFVILDRFLLFYCPNNLKNKNFEKQLVILSFHTGVPINDHHIMYGSWDTKCDLQNVL